jgi:hypothetical protein
MPCCCSRRSPRRYGWARCSIRKDDAEVIGNIIPFPDAQGDGLTLEQWHKDLLLLHQRLSAALTKERKQVDSIRMVLSIDDVMNLCQVIEDKLGPEWFSDEEPS